ncbi:hypothetical protein PUMCH_001544 [Australozyma saopauloensis]|uniref:non-specific serine/threonine protein kinase n=1 Tax=Australozyma saopauloensis TaxID=291208 RepID=A0AAX4H746_9ASCO|nr:hypothetical protein PUMCH_001544 [[Candida] saopauloensis]
MLSRNPSLMSTASQSHSHPQKIGPWKLGKTLGRGATGRVLLGVHQTTGQKAAVKVVSKSELGDDHGAQRLGQDGGLPYGIEREIIIMKLLTHPNVLRLYDVWETSKALYLVLEYVEGGELFDLLVERGPLHEQEAVKYFRQIILGTAYCHALGICHRDLKPENLLLDASLNVKLADFGMAALESNGKLLETSCGLPHYAAPEIVLGLKYHGAASDVWSCGVILFALLTGRLPFDDENIRNLLLKVQAGNFEMPADLSPEAQDLIWRMLTVDPSDRISTSLVLSHRLLNKYTVPNEDLISVKSLPHPDTAHRSLGSRKNIDPQILENLSILWNKRPEEDIVKCLLADGSNPEKTFYALLLRYRHNQDENQGLGIAVPGGSASPRKKMTRSSSNLSNTPRKNRQSQINASNSRNRPVSFQRRYGVKTGPTGRESAPSSVHNSPYRSPTRNARALPRKSKHQSYRGQDDPLPRNIYNDIVSAAAGGNVADSLLISIPPTLPSKDSIYAATGTPDTTTMDLAAKAGLGAKDGAKLSDAPKLVPNAGKAGKRSLMISKGPGSAVNSKNHKRKSIRQSLTTGLKRNSITIKLLSTYAKLSSETDWEYMDKQTKRTSATFATLCDKIFNHEAYNEEDEKLIDEEEQKAKEYEALMELERKKHEAEFKARRELAKQKKRQSRRSILSLRKLHITVTEDDGVNAKEMEEGEAARNSDLGGITQPKRGQKANAMRSVSEQAASDQKDLTPADLENLKRRSATQPVPHRRLTPVLARRPVSRLDPLWIAFENKEITRAQDALEAEFEDLNRERARKQANRELMVSVSYPGDAELEVGDNYELPEHHSEGANLSEEYMSEIRKLRLLNSQYDLQHQLDLEGAKRVSVAKSKRSSVNRRTLIGEVEIPKVTRKSGQFDKASGLANSKRLSLISFRSTKELYRDLNSFLDTHREDLDEAELAEEEQLNQQNMPKLRTSFADRLDRAEADDVDDDRVDIASVMDFDEHLANKRSSYYGGAKGSSLANPKSMLLPDDKDAQKLKGYGARRNSKYSKKSISEQSGKTASKTTAAAAADADYTFSEEDHEPRHASGSTNVFDNIKLPESGKDTRKSTSHRVSAHQPSASAMLVPNVNKIGKLDVKDGGYKSKTYGELSNSRNAQNSMTDVSVAGSDSSFGASTVVAAKPAGQPSNNGTQKPAQQTQKTAANPPREEKRSRSIFRKMSWGAKKSLEQNPQDLPSPAHSGLNSVEEKKGNLFSRIFSGNEKPVVQRYITILPKREIMTALYALLNSWNNFGIKELKKDMEGFNITGAVSNGNSFHMKGCKFRIKISPNDRDQKSELICAHVRGSKTTSQTLFKEIKKVLEREGVMDA